MPIIRTVQEIQEEIAKARGWIKGKSTDLPTMTYEEGVKTALTWTLDRKASEPILNEFEDLEEKDFPVGDEEEEDDFL